MAGRSTVRSLVWCAFAAQAAFVIAWLAAGALQRDYSHVEQGVSYLAANDADHPWIAAAAVVVLGASFAALGVALARVRSPRTMLPAALFAAVGASLALTTAFPLDCGAADAQRCDDLWHAGRLSWQHDAHLWLGLATTVLLLLTPFALARTLAPGTAAAAALTAGAIGVLIAVASYVAYGVPGIGDGLVQRAGLFVTHVWVLIVGGWLLHATRGARRTSELIPMRPRDFLAQSWTGSGELVLRPFFLGRFFAQRGEARRESTWISERLFRIDDEVHFGGGRFERRSMYCEFVSDDRVRLTGDDLIDGADVWLEEGGWRVSEFRLAWPIGPLPLIVRCADRSYVADDGTFVNRFDIYPLGPRIPFARVTFRMRPTTEAEPSSGYRQAVGLT